MYRTSRLRPPSSYQHLFYDTEEDTIAQVMDPAYWPEPRNGIDPIFPVKSLVFIYAVDGAAHCYVKALDPLKRPVLDFIQNGAPQPQPVKRGPGRPPKDSQEMF